MIECNLLIAFFGDVYNFEEEPRRINLAKDHVHIYKQLIR